MLFSSASFIYLFAPIVIGIFWYLQNKSKSTQIWIICASFLFYALSQYKGLPILIASLAINYWISDKIKGKSKALYVGVIFNLLVLGYFKYTNFFIENANVMLGTNVSLHRLFLPLGISFYTFIQIAYLVDIARGNAKKMSALNYLQYVSFFPQITAGPIVSYRQTGVQVEKPNYEFSWHKMYATLVLFIIGFAKKKLADNYAFFATDLFATDNLTFYKAWSGSLAYTFQLYFDFSGYCDMGMAIAKMLNINLPINFNSPYKADSIQDFWRRWHITLSGWLRDYLYIPLGGNRKGLARTLLNYFTVFLIGGFWHGAGWTFIVWGAMHGAGLAIHKLWTLLNKPMPKLPAIVLTFLFVHIAWVFFSAPSLAQAVNVICEMFAPTNFALPEWVTIRKYIFQCLFGAVFVFACPNSMQIFEKISEQKKYFFFALGLILIGLVLSVQANSSPVFLYFQF